MTKIYSLLLIGLGLLFGALLATQTDGYRYATPLLMVLACASLARLTIEDQ